MFGSRRLAKRSIVGTKVSARWKDGRYYSGVIQGQYAEESPFSDAIYTVKFEDGNTRNISNKHIIGQGFQAITYAVLKTDQDVFVTLNGREVDGTVVQHCTDKDEVLINCQLQNGDDIEITKRLEEVRLLKSRKSARLIDQDTDYSKLADLQLSEAKRRTVSQGIDVPNKLTGHAYWYSQDELIDDQDNNNSGDGDDDVEMMDENIAAMVLTSLSCSPQSPPMLKELAPLHKLQLSSSASSSGYHSALSDGSNPSPPTTHLSESAPAGTGGLMFGPFPQDEMVDVEEEGKENNDNNQGTMQKKTMFQCTWPKCGKISSTCTGIEKHVRDIHLGLKEEGSSDSEHEEEFYYTEIEVNVDNVTRGFSDMCTSSPPNSIVIERSTVIPDHDYQKKDYLQPFASSVPSGGSYFTHGQTTPMPINIPQIKRSLSWQSSHTFSSSPSPPMRPLTKMSPHERLQQHQAQSPKIHSLSPPKMAACHKKSRSDVRKCRKVYGMENRDMWCTQCKWKKACTRFLD